MYQVSKTELDLINLPDEPCNETEAEIDFSACMKNAVEQKIKCSIPDMTSGTPMASAGIHKLPVCSSTDDFLTYTAIYQDLEFTSESEIFKTFQCLPKCKGSIWKWTNAKNSRIFLIFCDMFSVSDFLLA